MNNEEKEFHVYTYTPSEPVIKTLLLTNREDVINAINQNRTHIYTTIADMSNLEIIEIYHYVLFIHFDGSYPRIDRYDEYSIKKEKARLSGDISYFMYNIEEGDYLH